LEGFKEHAEVKGEDNKRWALNFQESEESEETLRITNKNKSKQYLHISAILKLHKIHSK
jgi:hypothetical protein